MSAWDQTIGVNGITLHTNEITLQIWTYNTGSNLGTSVSNFRWETV